MSYRDDRMRYVVSRQLRLLGGGNGQAGHGSSLISGSVRRLGIELSQRPLHDLEVPIASAEGTGGAPAPERGSTGMGEDSGEFSRLALICSRIASGAYNSPEVLDSVARSIVASGELTSSPARSRS